MNNRYLGIMRDKITLQNILMMRTCPPDKVLFSGSDQARKHSRGCFMCRERLEDKIENSHPVGADGRPLLPRTDPGPGQVWTISPDLAGWGINNMYYNPLSVFILKKVDHLAFEVAQVSFDQSFYSPGEDIMIKDMNVFVQPWNTYTMAGRHLCSLVSEPGPDLLIQLEQRLNNGFRDLDPDSFQYLFRQAEIECGSFFARKSISWLVEQHEGTELTLSTQVIRDVFRRKYPGGRPFEETDDALLFLARSTLPDNMQARAASDAEGMSINHVILRGDDFEMYSVSASITLQRLTKDGLEIFVKLNTNIEDLEVYAWWEDQDQVITPSDLEYEKDSPYFRAFFKHSDKSVFENGTLILMTTGYE